MAYEDAKTGQAKALRARMTLAERRLWSRLRGGRFYGLRWLRQEPLGPFVADFYCATARVAELVGAKRCGRGAGTPALFLPRTPAGDGVVCG